jgi:DNA-binding response OmpR family regulator
VVEHDPLLQEIVSHFLCEEGYRVSVAGTLEGAQQALRASRFDLVLTDTSGVSSTETAALCWRVLNQIRDLAGDTPVVIVSGQRPEAFSEFGARGYRDVLPKPFTLRALLTLVARHITAADV